VDEPAAGSGAGPDHARASLPALLRRNGPRPLAEVVADMDLPVTAVRVLLGDLVDSGLARVYPPSASGGRPDPELLREVIRGLRAL
jgi:predicted ArsR family transcriptional regulator